MDIFPSSVKGRPSYLLAVCEAQAILGLLSSFLTIPLVSQYAPKGQGQPVLILPGFMQLDISTFRLQKFLRSLGYLVYMSELGLNRGYSDGLDLMLGRRLREVYQTVKTPINIIGQSLGGTYAREMARIHPERVRQVISFGSPFTGNLKDTNVTWLYDLVSAKKLDKLPKDLIKRMKQKMPVPSTSIYSPTDGVVSNACSFEPASHQAQNIMVLGSHCGMGWNPLVFWIIADRLAQPADTWQKFSWSSLLEIFF